MTEKEREARARRALARDGLILNKSRVKNLSCDDQGGYRIVDLYTNRIEAGERFDLSLEDVEMFARDGEAQGAI